MFLSDATCRATSLRNKSYIAIALADGKKVEKRSEGLLEARLCSGLAPGSLGSFG